jgi:hypothetical protein
MSTKRNRRSRRPGNRRPPGAVPPRRVSGQYLGHVRTARSRGRPEAQAPAVAQPAAEPGDQTPPPSSGGRSRRLPASTAALVGIVGLEVAALAVLGAHLVSGRHEVAPVSADRSYAAPVDVPAGTAYVRSRLVAPDTLAVTHWIHTGRPVSSLRIQVPRTPGLAAGQVAVTNLVIASGGRSVPGSVLPAAGSLRTYVLPPGRRIYVSYVLTGTVRSSGSPPGRALAQITALDVATPQGPFHRTVFRVVGAKILALACAPNRPNGIALPCGETVAGGWQVDLRGARSDDRVMAQMDLS